LANQNSHQADQILRLLSQALPIESLSLLVLLGQAGTTDKPGILRRVLYVEKSGNANTETLDLPCSLSRWAELHKWALSGALLDQPSPKRSGKLAWIATEELRGSLMAFGLQLGEPATEGVFAGIVVFEIEHARSIQPESNQLLTELAAPLAFYLQKLVAQKVESPTLDRSFIEDQEQSESIVGSGHGLKKVMERVALVSNSDMPVLILGDTGTGKEVIARAIHARSPRASKPFLRVNCGAIPPELIDSQLFGHERGSFTGASDQRKGWFERASGGTLFLDEVGELPLAAQVRLLRVLQEHQIERVGGERTINVDVRIVAATHRDLASMVHQRTFREDLWYRINLFPILLPRLCERLEDIPALTRHFAKKAAAKLGLPYAEPKTSDIDQLLRYSWPGNIRELQAVVDRAVILGRGHHLDIATALGSGFTIGTHPISSSEEPTFYEVIPESSYLQAASILEQPSVPLVQNQAEGRLLPLNELIKQHIEKVLVRCSGQVEGKRGAARILQINPHTLRAKMRKLGIRWADYRRDDDDSLE
jgi:transcriptional regulator with GAF, ATPase, and Fis domain